MVSWEDTGFKSEILKASNNKYDIGINKELFKGSNIHIHISCGGAVFWPFSNLVAFYLPALWSSLVPWSFHPLVTPVPQTNSK